MANAFESRIGQTFQSYRDLGLANLRFLHPPMRVAGMHGKVPCYIQAGKAPYDIDGYYYDGAGTGIGVELKQTRKHEERLQIVKPKEAGGSGKGDGLKYHQLNALVDTHEAGGVALLLWDNGGEIGLLSGDQLKLVKVQYDASLKAEENKKEIAKGSRSILWGWFKPVKEGHEGQPLWLPPSPAPIRKKKSA